MSTLLVWDDMMFAIGEEVIGRLCWSWSSPTLIIFDNNQQIKMMMTCQTRQHDHNDVVHRLTIICLRFVILDLSMLTHVLNLPQTSPRCPDVLVDIYPHRIFHMPLAAIDENRLTMTSMQSRDLDLGNFNAAIRPTTMSTTVIYCDHLISTRMTNLTFYNSAENGPA